MALPRRLPELTPAQMRNRRLRNIAIAVCVGFMAVLFYALTLVRMGAGAFHGQG